MFFLFFLQAGSKKACILEFGVIYYFGNRSDGRSIRTGWCMLVASY